MNSSTSANETYCASFKAILEKAKTIFPDKSKFKPEFTSDNFMKTIVKDNSSGKYDKFSKDYEDILEKIGDIMSTSEKILEESNRILSETYKILSERDKILEGRDKIIYENHQIRSECSKILSGMDIPNENPLKRKFNDLYDYESLEDYTEQDVHRLYNLFDKEYHTDDTLNLDDMTKAFIEYTDNTILVKK